jgi:transposase
MQHTTVAVDVAKSVFEVAVSHRPGRVSEGHRFTRKRFARFLAEQAPGTVVMEACGMAHFWAREAQARGHAVRLLPPRDVRPYGRGNKTDRSDTKAILEANRNEAIQPVPVKSVEQHALTGLHRMRSSWVATRTARLNTIRGLLRELGVTIPVGARGVVPPVWELVSDAESGLPDPLRPVLAEAAREVSELERRIREVAPARRGRPAESDRRAPSHDPGRGAADGDGHRRLDERPEALPLGATLRQRSGLDAARVLERERTPLGPHHEARRPVPADAAPARRPIGAAPRQAPRETGSIAVLGARTRTGAGSQQGRSRRGEQAGADRLGRVGARGRLPRTARSGLRLIPPEARPPLSNPMVYR